LRRRRAKVVLDLHEIFPEFVASKFPGPAGQLLTWVATAIERWARRQADATITVNHPIARLLDHRAPAEAPPQVVIHNTPDPAEFGNPRDPRPAGLSTIRCVYHGTLTSLYGLDIAIRGIAASRRAGVDAHFTIIGDGPDRRALESLVQQLGPDHGVTFKDPQAPSWLKEVLPTFDAGIVPTRLDDMTRYSLSNKLLEYVHLGVPVLAARLPSYAEYFPDTSAWFWTPNDSEALARAIVGFAHAPLAERTARARAAQEAVVAIAWAGERERLISLYTGLTASSGRGSQARSHT
jgi:glycosyltransferase involved in cell wall biosynthesis